MGVQAPQFVLYSGVACCVVMLHCVYEHIRDESALSGERERETEREEREREKAECVYVHIRRDENRVELSAYNPLTKPLLHSN